MQRKEQVSIGRGGWGGWRPVLSAVQIIQTGVSARIQIAHIREPLVAAYTIAQGEGGGIGCW